MASRYGALMFYSGGLFALACVLIAIMGQAAAWPGPLTWLLSVAAFLFVWSFGVRAPVMGLVSLERVVQFTLLLVYEPVVAAALNAAAALVYPFINRAYNLGSMRVACLRAMHNVGMVSLMMLAAGHVYQLLDGELPLHTLDLADLVPVTVAALVMQVINDAMLGVYYHLDGRDPRHLYDWLYLAGDLLFVPGGVLGAVLLASSEPPTFWLFVGLIAFFVLCFHLVGNSQTLLEAQLDAIRSVHRAGRALSGANRVDALAEHILEQVRSLVRFEEFYLVLVDRERGEMEFRLHERDGKRMPSRRKALDRGLFGWVLETGTNLLIEDFTRTSPELRERAIHTGKSSGSFIAVPLRGRDQCIGLISVQHGQAHVYAQPDMELVQTLSDRAASVLADAQAFEELDDYKHRLERRVEERTAELEQAARERESLLAELARQSSEDSLTGLANRREFDRRLDQDVEQARLHKEPLALLLLDADHFKDINDRHGHAVGDAVLRELGRLIQARCHPVETAARIGGEEFAILLPRTDAQHAQRFAENLRTDVESHAWTIPAPCTGITISIGVAHWNADSNADELLRHADQQLYAAKRAGRNCVMAMPASNPHP